ncbi:MAG: hydantoinase/oxoprolinase family protein [Thermodesulfobacteriota bacterium]
MMILGIDVGGTHTDAVLIDHTGVLKKTKVPTDDGNLLSSLLAVTSALADGDMTGRMERVVLSSTLSTNAIVQNRVDRVGMMVISGPGIAPSALNIPQDTHFLSGYVNHRGAQVLDIDPAEAAQVCHRFRAEGIGQVGIVGKFSPRNPGHELRLKAMVEPGVRHVTVGHRLSGHLNFPRRIATAYLNEAVWNRYSGFVREVLRFIRERTPGIPVYILKADGGTFDIGQSLEFPVQTILSGPAASIMGILALTNCSTDAIALDIGGTTTDISLFADGVPLFEPIGVTIEGHQTLIRGLRTASIGIGGDSAVRVRSGLLTIGPEREGPAAAFGGPLPTPTDAMVVLGLAAVGDPVRAAAALRPVSSALACPVEQAAEMIYRETCRRIAARIRDVIGEINDRPVYTIHEMLQDRRISPRHLYVVGGPAGSMAAELGRLLGCEPHIPEHAEVANAVGAALARTTVETTLLADTERGLLTVSEEGYQTRIPPRFSAADAIRIGTDRLVEKALRMGTDPADTEIEVVEVQEFNMVRGFMTTGKNIRVKLQIKPGSIAGYSVGGAPC